MKPIGDHALIGDCHSAALVDGDGRVSAPGRVDPTRSILRRLRCTEGTVDVDVRVAPRFEYGRFVPRFRLTSEETAADRRSSPRVGTGTPSGWACCGRSGLRRRADRYRPGSW